MAQTLLSLDLTSVAFKFQRISGLVILGCILLLGVSCKKEEADTAMSLEGFGSEPIEITDDWGRDILLERPAIEVVSLVPSLTEYLFELELGHLLVGRSEACRYPEKTAEIPVMGTNSGADVSRIKELDPDVVLVSTLLPKSEVQRLEAAGLKVAVFALDDWESIQKDLLNLGKLLDATGDIKTVLGWFSKQREIIQEEWQYTEKLPISAAIVCSLDPLILVEHGTYIDEFITFAGGKNVVQNQKDAGSILDISFLREQHPEVLLFSSAIAADIGTFIEVLKSEPWKKMPAVLNNRIYLIEPDYLNIPGPRQITALRQIAAALHPEIFEAPPELRQVLVR